MSEKCFVNEMVKLLRRAGFQQPSLRIKQVFSLMMEGVAIALQSRQKCKDLNLVEFHISSSVQQSPSNTG